MRVPDALAPVRARRRAAQQRALTRRLAAAATLATTALAGVELARVWHRGTAAPPRRPAELLSGGRVAAAETVAVLRAGYREGSANETAVLNLFLAFGGTWAATRAITHAIRAGVGPWGNVVVGRRHVHHFLPGMLASILAGGASIVLRHEGADQWLALPFGAGVALVTDETALLLELEDVYWSDEGLVSIHVGLGSLTLLAALALGVRLLRRGERSVLA